MTKKELMRQYKADGHTAKEVAIKFGVSREYASRICSGINPQNKRRSVEDMLDGFEYVGNYTGADGTVDIRCKTCGTITTRSMITVRHNNVRCRECEKKNAEERNRLKQIEHERHQLEHERERARKSKAVQISFKPCAECGKLFIPKHGNQMTCSVICSRKRINRKKDRRININNTIDNDITLSKLFNRDGGVCYLCGCRCNWDDSTQDGNGYTIIGNTYPTIEHVIPISKGGMHSWSNVKLACYHCNTIKGNAYPLVHKKQH